MVAPDRVPLLRMRTNKAAGKNTIAARAHEHTPPSYWRAILAVCVAAIGVCVSFLLSSSLVSNNHQGGVASATSRAIPSSLNGWGERGRAQRDTAMTYYNFSSEDPAGEVITQHTGSVLQQYDGAGDRGKRASFFIARRHASFDEAHLLLDAAASAEAHFKRNDADTIDGKPSFERYVVQRGKVVDRRAFAAFAPMQPSIVATVRSTMDCPRCELCDVLMRRYRPGERRGVGIHRDINAYATAILTLNADHFRGGYFVADAIQDRALDGRGDNGGDGERMQGEAVLLGEGALRKLHLLLDSGDLLVHGHNVQHGVNVSRGVRVSLVAWFKDRPGICAKDENPWVRELANAGDADAAFHEMQYAQRQGDAAEARRWMELAAGREHGGAMVALALALYRERNARSAAAAGRWVEKSARLGRRDGMALLAWALDNGAGVTRDPQRGLFWRRKAARLGHPQAILELQQAGVTLD